MNREFNKLSNTEYLTRVRSTLTDLFVVDIKTYSIRLKLKLLFGYMRLSLVLYRTKARENAVAFSQQKLELYFIDVVKDIIRAYQKLVTSVKFASVELDTCEELSEATHELIKQELEAQFVG